MSSSLYKTKLSYLQHSVAIDSTLLYPVFTHFLNYVVSSLKAGGPFYICLPYRDKSLEKFSLVPLPDFLMVRVCCIHQAIIPQCYETSPPHLIPKTGGNICYQILRACMPHVAETADHWMDVHPYISQPSPISCTRDIWWLILRDGLWAEMTYIIPGPWQLRVNFPSPFFPFPIIVTWDGSNTTQTAWVSQWSNGWELLNRLC